MMDQTYDHHSGQLGFDALLTAADTDNKQRQWARETSHLPGDMEGGLAYYGGLLEAHHAAMMAANVEEVAHIRSEARLLARKLNGGEPGILASPEAPGSVLAQRTAAPEGTVSLWGQDGAFITEIEKMSVRIEMEGIFGISSRAHWLGFSIHAVNWDQPFLSETGYRSFLGVSIALQPGISPVAFVQRILCAYLHDELKGKPLKLAQRYRRDHRAASG